METTTQLSPVSALALLNSNKSQRRNFVLQIVEQIENGEVDPLKVHGYLKNMEQIVKMLLDEKVGKEFAQRYKVQLVAAAEKEGGKEFEKYNATFQIKEAGTKWDYSVCNDSVINDLLAKQKEIDDAVKERQDFLKSIPDSGLILTDQETGETVHIYKPAKSSTTTIAVTLS